MAEAAAVTRLARHEYAFASTWLLTASRSRVYEVLADPLSYPQWWPGFLQAEQVDERSGRFALRSRLPLTLHFTLHRDVETEPRLLRACAAGDIEGSVEWNLVDVGPGRTIAYFSQRVVLRHPWARRVDALLKPVLTWNHAQSMRGGRVGLQEWLRR